MLLEGTTSSPTRIEGRQGMDVQATQNDINAARHPDARWYGLFGGTSSPGGNTDNLTNLVDADAGVTVVVAPRPTAATSGQVPATPLDTFAGFNNLALLGKANNTNIATRQGADVNESRKIDGDADVVVRSGAAPELVIDALGRVTRATTSPSTASSTRRRAPTLAVPAGSKSPTSSTVASAMSSSRPATTSAAGPRSAVTGGGRSRSTTRSARSGSRTSPTSRCG